MFQISPNIVAYPESQSLVVSVNDPVQKHQLSHLPGVRWQEIGTYTMVELPWTVEACQVLSNIGLDATFASPIWQEEPPLIESKYSPMAHQMLTAAFITLHPRCYILSDCRLGKTGSAILALSYLQKHREIAGGILIITTVTTMTSVWAASIRETLPDDRIAIVHGKDKKAALASQAEWYITNYDSVRLKYDWFQKAVTEKRIACVLIDELTHVGNASSQRHQRIYDLVNKTSLRYVIGMTGSPGCRPEPVYGMARTVNPSKLPVRTKTGWMNLTTLRYGPQPFQYRPVSNVGEIIKSTLSPAIRFKKEEVLDLPPIVFQTRECQLSKEQNKMLSELRSQACTFAKSGETITAANAAVLVSKLLQVPLGFILSEGQATDLQEGTRADVILEAVRESDRKTVIFSMFRRRLALLVKMLQDASISVALIDGSVSGTARADILTAFKTKSDPQVLVCHPTTVGFGTELSAADTLILDGPPLLGDFSYTQTLERLSSPKQQSSKISIIKVVATLEERNIFKRLDEGQEHGKIIAKLFEDLLTEQ